MANWRDDVKDQIRRILREESTFEEAKVDALFKVVRDAAVEASIPRDSIDM